MGSKTRSSKPTIREIINSNASYIIQRYSPEHSEDNGVHTFSPGIAQSGEYITGLHAYARHLRSQIPALSRFRLNSIVNALSALLHSRGNRLRKYVPRKSKATKPQSSGLGRNSLRLTRDVTLKKGDVITATYRGGRLRSLTREREIKRVVVDRRRDFIATTTNA